MKSLLQTLPKAEKITLWGAEIRTNLKFVYRYRFSKKRNPEEAFLLENIVEIFSKIEMNDLRVRRASITKRGRVISAWAASEKTSGGQMKVKIEMRMSKCVLCGRNTFEGSPLSKEQTRFHGTGCPIVDMTEVMES